MNNFPIIFWSCIRVIKFISKIVEIEQFCRLYSIFTLISKPLESSLVMFLEAMFFIVLIESSCVFSPLHDFAVPPVFTVAIRFLSRVRASTDTALSSATPLRWSHSDTALSSATPLRWSHSAALNCIPRRPHFCIRLRELQWCFTTLPTFPILSDPFTAHNVGRYSPQIQGRELLSATFGVMRGTSRR